MILDGWGISNEFKGNAILQAKTPNYDTLISRYPSARIDASGPAVGLPQGVMGNSEVGHLNIGSGRIASVGLTRIYQSIEAGGFFKNAQFLKAMQAVRTQGGALHLMGLVSDGAVHSHQDHLYALLKMAKDQGLKKVFIHAIMDGRDTAPKSAYTYIRSLEEEIEKIGLGRIATVSGRYYTMDRDQRWERVQLAYDAMVNGKGLWAEHALSAIAANYDDGKSDEFILPTVIVEGDQPVGQIQDSDALIFFNFRADRAREITQALVCEDFVGFSREVFPNLSHYVCMMEYEKGLPVSVAFEPNRIDDVLAKVISDHGLKQLRIAETEKYAHVTFFFNGGEEKVYPGEERILVPSPKEVATYDLKPEMSAAQVCEKVLVEIAAEKHDLIILNFANPDMVGHTGNLPAAIQAVEYVDECIGKIAKAIKDQDGVLVICADHGNAEKEIDENGLPHTSHTTNLTPFIVVGEKYKNSKLRAIGKLSDIAPTLLEILDLPIPSLMNGESMFCQLH